MKKGFIITTALMLSMATLTPTLASTNDIVENNETSLINLEEENSAVTEVQIEKYENYIQLNEDNRFVINSLGDSELNESEKLELSSILSNSNKNIDLVIENSSKEEALEIQVVSPEKNVEPEIMLMAASYKTGINKVSFHWWGMKVLLSKTTANKALNYGTTLAGIWLPSRVLSSVGATLSLTSTGLFKGGIWIDQYYVASVGPVKTLFGFNSAGYQ